MRKAILPVACLMLVGTLLLYSTRNSAAAPATHVVISEVQVGGGVAEDEFVELFNPTDNPVDLSGWRLTKKTSTGTQSTLTASMSGTIPAHSFFLIGGHDYAGSTATDSAYVSNSVSVTANNTVILYSDAGVTVVDKVGMGTAVDFEGTATTSPTDGQSVQRTDPHLDTNNNSSDFFLQTVPNPQNSLIVIAPTPTPLSTPTNTPTPTTTPGVAPTETPTQTPTATPTDEPTPTVTVTVTPTTLPTPTPTEEPTQTPIPTITPTSTPTETPSPTPTPTEVVTPTSIPTVTDTPTPTLTSTPVLTPTPTNFPPNPFPNFHVSCQKVIKTVTTKFFTLHLPILKCSISK